MEWVPAACRLFLYGLRDALNPYWVVLYVCASPVIRKATLKCGVLNGVLFLGSMFLLHVALMPTIHMFGRLVLRFQGDGPAGDLSGLANSLVDGVVFTIYQIFWIIPLYCISVLMNTIWYSKIADAAYELHHRKKADVSIKVTISENLYRIVLVVFYIVQCSAVFSFLGTPGQACGFLLVCCINALYSFESAWAMQGMDLQRRLTFLESNWAYFVGFGTPVALMCHFWSTMVGLGVFAVCFPACIIQATCSQFSRPQAVHDVVGSDGECIPRVPIFRFAVRATNMVLRLLDSRAQQGKRR